MASIIESKNANGFDAVELLSDLSSNNRISLFTNAILISLKAHGWKETHKQDDIGMTALHRAVLLNANPIFLNELKKYIDEDIKDINGLKYSDYLCLKNYILNDVNNKLPTSRYLWEYEKKLPGNFDNGLSELLTNFFKEVTSTSSEKYLTLKEQILKQQKIILSKKENDFSYEIKELLNQTNVELFLLNLNVKLQSKEMLNIDEIEAVWEKLKSISKAENEVSIPIEVYYTLKNEILKLPNSKFLPEPEKKREPIYIGERFQELKANTKLVEIKPDFIIKEEIENLLKNMKEPKVKKK